MATKAAKVELAAAPRFSQTFKSVQVDTAIDLDSSDGEPDQQPSKAECLCQDGHVGSEKDDKELKSPNSQKTVHYDPSSVEAGDIWQDAQSRSGDTIPHEAQSWIKSFEQEAKKSVAAKSFEQETLKSIWNPTRAT